MALAAGPGRSCSTRILVFVNKNKGLVSTHKSHTRNTLPLPCTSCCFSTSTPTNPLLQKLLKVPNSSIKPTLDSLDYDSFTFKSSELSWVSLLTALKSSSPPKAQLVMEWRLEKLLETNEKKKDCYAELISLCGKLQNFPLALRVFASMEAQGIEPTSSVFNGLLSACLSSGNIITAISLFEIMQFSEAYKPNSDTYNAFILAFANLGNDKAMQAWYSAKIAAGFSADLETYESLILGCIKSTNLDDADRFYDEMTLAGVVPSLSILQCMLARFCDKRCLGKVKDFLKYILDGGWGVNEYIAERLVRLYCEMGRVEDMEELLLTLTMSHQVSEVLSLVHSGIVRMYAMSDRLDDVEYSVGRMLKQGISFRCIEDIEKVICSYFRRAAYDRLDLFLECIKGSHKLSKSTYDLLVAGYRRAGLSKKLDAFMNDMKLAGYL